MAIQFQCAQCKRPLSVDPRHAGAKVKCPNCGHLAPVPDAARPAAKPGAEPPEEVPPVRFAGKRTVEDEMDMTPMVDITFLLLIFFMVTATYSLQRSLEVPPPDPQDEVAETKTLEEFLEEDPHVIVEIHGDNTIFVDGSPATSEHELLLRLREARHASSEPISNLLVMAHGNCRHETVVMALDAGNSEGMEHVRLTSQEEDF